MAMIAQRSLVQLRDWNRSFWTEVSQDASIPQSVKSMIYQHILSLWVHDALAVVISPLGSGQNNPYLKQSVFDLGGVHYYYPSVAFWQAHAKRAHPPNGENCDAEAHIDFLTQEGSAAEFIYSVVLKNGTLIPQDADAFITECAYWVSGSK